MGAQTNLAVAGGAELPIASKGNAMYYLPNLGSTFESME